MLVLARRTRETIVVPALNLTITVLDVRSGTVRLGIEAPPEVEVVRGELQQRGGRVTSRPAKRRLLAVR